MKTRISVKTVGESTDPKSNPIITVIISNYPLSNGGYLVNLFKEKEDRTLEPYDAGFELDFEATKLDRFLAGSYVFLPEGCFYLPNENLGRFVKSLAYGTSFFDVSLVPASPRSQGLLLIKVDEDSFFEYESEKEE